MTSIRKRSEQRKESKQKKRSEKVQVNVLLVSVCPKSLLVLQYIRTQQCNIRFVNMFIIVKGKMRKSGDKSFHTTKERKSKKQEMPKADEDISSEPELHKEEDKVKRKPRRKAKPADRAIARSWLHEW